MIRLLKFLIAAVIFSTLAPTFAHAQPARTFVSSFGTDANACTVAAPCRTLQRGIDAVAGGGDVLIVDAGGFGANVMITKSVSVIAPPGGQSRIRQALSELTGGNEGVIVSGDNNIAVSISGLGITGGEAGGASVRFLSGRSLNLSGMDINNVNNSTAIVHRSGGGHLSISDTVVRNAGYCLSVEGLSSAPARATIARMIAQGCLLGFESSSYSYVAISQSQVAGNAGCSYGFFIGLPASVMTLDEVVATGCIYGIYAVAEGAVTLSNSVLTGNEFAGVADTGSAAVGRSYGNNRIFGNGTDALTGFTPIAEQ